MEGVLVVVVVVVGTVVEIVLLFVELDFVILCWNGIIRFVQNHLTTTNEGLEAIIKVKPL